MSASLVGSEMCIRDSPSGPEQRGCRRGCTGAWRTCPAGTLQEGAQRTHPHRNRRADGRSARR
eukprot:960679-Alexandrium_andersonii.AAC.1